MRAIKIKNECRTVVFGIWLKMNKLNAINPLNVIFKLDLYLSLLCIVPNVIVIFCLRVLHS